MCCCGSSSGSSSSSCTTCGCPGGLPDTLYASGTCNITLTGSNASGHWESSACTIGGCPIVICVDRRTSPCTCSCQDYAVSIGCGACGTAEAIGCVVDDPCCPHGPCSCSPLELHYACCSAIVNCCTPSAIGDICITITT